MKIVDLATREGRVDAQDAAERLSVAVETIRRDLDVLQRRGLMRRVHGGAIAVHRLNREFTVSERRALNHSAKLKIAEVAARHIPEQGTIIVDSGTTTQCLSVYLRDKSELTVVTNSLDLATEIGSTSTRVILISGRIRPTTMSGVGDLALKALENISADVAFIGANGVDLKSGFTTPDPDEA
ncbi:MAG: DeoR/GlpR transcriptional regulator, partial [Actinobacteria bacterium]|nr:DeoR/GlpR transcriptional regulator [Actinomycetota bacterium]